MHAEATVQSSLKLPVLNQNILRIGFGCEALGGFNWGDVDIEAINLAISHALAQAHKSGQSVLFDTSDTYGPHLSEERLGAALAGHRQDAIIATKFGVRLQDGKAWYDTSPSWMDQALDNSLERLQTDVIDLYQLHWPDQTTPLTDTLAALEDARSEGRIRAFGVCNVPLADLLSCTSDFPGLASFSQSYSLLNRTDEKDIRTLCDQGMAFIAYGCLAQGLLSGKYNAQTQFAQGDRRHSDKYIDFHGARLERNLKIVEDLKVHAEDLDRPVATLALQFVLEDLPNAIALAGIKSTEQWAGNAAALNGELGKDRLHNLQDLATRYVITGEPS